MITNPNPDAHKVIPDELGDYNWEEVFGEGTGGNCTPIVPNRQPPTAEISIETFGRADVAEIFKMVDGENDGPEWVVYGRLRDGRFFVARGGCDYTGWDCQASNSGDVANTRSEIERYGLSDDERSRLGIILD